jgi:hypothetical protein
MFNGSLLAKNKNIPAWWSKDKFQS